MTNPFFEDWTAPFGAPPLDRIKAEHFPPAYDRALAEHAAEIAAIAENRDPPSFDNMVLALEKSGQLLTRVEGVFGNLTSSATNEALQAMVQEDLHAKLATSVITGIAHITSIRILLEDSLKLGSIT